MEVVFLLVAIAGIALMIVGRMQRRNSARRRPARSRTRKGPAKRVRGRKRTAAAPAVATWTPAPLQASSTASELDAWDDDLGWEGVENAAPETREAWERWRETESPLAGGAKAEPEPEPELPSVERWRAKAQEPDWREDDDGLGWEGQSDEDVDATEPASWTSNGRGPAPEPRDWTTGNGHGPAPEPGRWTGAGASGRDWSRNGSESAAEPLAPALASASAATDVASKPDPEAGRTFELEDDDWDPPVGRAWGGDETAPAPRVAAPRRKRGTRLHPVLVLAMYAAAGIGLVVLASTALLGGSADPEPTSSKPPQAAPTATASPQATPTVAASDTAAEEAAAAAAASERKARTAFRTERRRAERSRNAAIDRARADARREAKARDERTRNRPSSTSTPPTAATPAPPAASTAPPSNTTPPRTYTPPAPPPCEFCIG